jgi:VanZ family protein
MKQKIGLLLIGVTYGILIEVLQSTMALGRSYDIGDIVSNTVGCIVGVILITFVQRTVPLLKKYLPFLNKLY